jgi:hypothetical protein
MSGYGFISGVAAIAIWMTLTIWEMQDHAATKEEAIQRGYALHCPQTGDFAWKGECND